MITREIPRTLTSRLGRRPLRGFLSGSALLILGCAGPTLSMSSDSTRALSPVPVCVKDLPPRDSTGFARQLPGRDFFDLVIPGLETESPDSGTLACSGVPVFDSPPFVGTRYDVSAIEEERITWGAGSNRLKVLWLRTHVGEGEEAGPLALVRVLESHAEVYGVGAFRGKAKKSRFGTERMGQEIVVTAISDGCSETPKDAPCDTFLVAFLPVSGRLSPIGSFSLERRRFATGVEQGVQGTLGFHEVASVAFRDDGVHSVEEVIVTDLAGRQVRRASFERSLRLANASLVAEDEPLWDRVYPGQAREEKRASPEAAENENGTAAPTSKGVEHDEE